MSAAYPKRWPRLNPAMRLCAYGGFMVTAQGADRNRTSVQFGIGRPFRFHRKARPIPSNSRPLIFFSNLKIVHSSIEAAAETKQYRLLAAGFPFLGESEDRTFVSWQAGLRQLTVSETTAFPLNPTSNPSLRLLPPLPLSGRLRKRETAGNRRFLIRVYGVLERRLLSLPFFARSSLATSPELRCFKML